MTQIFISGRAEEDLINQYRWYLDNASADIAERVLISFNSMVERLARSPELGRLRRFRARKLANIRSVALAVRLAPRFLQVHHTRLRIERVMHGARDLPRRLAARP
jgi:toxin ParE1/3/4